MDYELAKQLKNAGFTQEGKHDCCYQACCTEGKGEVCFPTLSELIEACGDKFKVLEREKDEGGEYWWANSVSGAGDVLGEVSVSGSTPEESVARLWLALQNK